MAPILDSSHILGGLYTAGDGYVNAAKLAEALAKGAQNGGATIVEGCPKIKSITQSKNDWIIQFEDGNEIKTRNVINAAGKVNVFTGNFFYSCKFILVFLELFSIFHI